MLLSVIIPCYNEELVIEETYKRLTSVLGSMQHSYELIFINDGSRDKTYDILFQLSEKDAKVKILHFSRNFGHQCAVTAGINHCNGDAAVIIDSDLQDPPEVIIDMLKIMEEEKANVVYGVRKKRKGETWFKLVTAKYFYRILNSLSDVKFPVDTGDFRLIDRNIIDTFNRMEEKNKYIRGLISWMGYKQVPCYYEMTFVGFEEEEIKAELDKKMIQPRK
jgi:glycosyltransferase involved in cell wall biosynthesis